MVDDRVTDGKRLGELLASEIDSRTDSGLERSAVRNSIEEASPSPTGTEAFEIWMDEEPIGSVVLYPDRLDIEFGLTDEAIMERAESVGLGVRDGADHRGVVVRVEDGVAVKAMVEVFLEVL